MLVKKIVWILALVLLAGSSGIAGAASPEQELAYRKRVAASDLRFASVWIAEAYDIPARVPQELLLAGYDYAEVLTALAFMSEGASLNRVLELRRHNLWPDIARALDMDPLQLPEPIVNLETFGRNPRPGPPALRFLPDVRPGLAHRMKIPAFSSTVPGPEMVEEFRLSGGDVENIRKVLNDPLGVEDEDLLLPAGRDLTAGDWVMAGVIEYLKPFPMETVLEARQGVKVGWGEVVLVFGLRPDVLTEGPLAAFYPVLSGTHPDAVLAGRKRRDFPPELPLNYDLERLTVSERHALEPLMFRTYRATRTERALLTRSGLEFTERGIALALTRMSQIDLATLLGHREKGENWSQIIRRFAIDTRGQEGLLAAIRVREEDHP
ncbi:MAG: hypothetical protein AB1758_26980 [Candidatus Eremiobacterota bacterium]